MNSVCFRVSDTVVSPAWEFSHIKASSISLVFVLQVCLLIGYPGTPVNGSVSQHFL